MAASEDGQPSEEMKLDVPPDTVQPKHVKEAFRLLNKSIIRVEQPDIHLEEEEENEQMEVEEERENVAPEDANSKSPEKDSSGAPKKGLKLSYEEYRHMANLMVLHMRQKEEGSEESSGLRRSEVISWYLNELEGDIETEAELLERKTVIEKVIDRLVHHDHVIIELKQTGLKARSKVDEEELVREDDPFLVVHPNYVIDG